MFRKIRDAARLLVEGLDNLTALIQEAQVLVEELHSLVNEAKNHEKNDAT